MKKILELITEELKTAFEKEGLSTDRVSASISNRPDLCEYQCNSCMALAKEAKCKPMDIAEKIAGQLNGNPKFSEVTAVMPGFINIKVSGEFITDYINGMEEADKFGVEAPEKPLKIIVDYGGPNVAKPLHIGHLRAAIIGESIKRVCSFVGNEAIGDVHLGDWGLQMGQIIAELEVRQPDLPYFDEDFTGEYPKEAPFTISELEEIYPTASKKCKKDSDTYDEVFAEKAHEATMELQAGRPGYRAIWEHVLRISKEDLKKNYENLDVHFELWKGESDVQPYIPDMVEKLKSDGLAYESQGAWVVDVTKDTDKKEMPPCIVVKSDGSSLYSTTDIATLLEREKLYQPDYVIYVVDKRQAMHLEQVFRVTKMAGIVPENTKLFHLGFGTMNGKDGQPYKTRSGGVMRLESLINEVNEAVLEKMKDNDGISKEEAEKTSKIIALAALKYGDLSNQATKDYIFDIGRFIEFEGNTGPYILYTIVRIKSILNKAGAAPDGNIVFTGEPTEKALMLELAKFNDVIENAYEELAPHKICSFIYDLSNAFNSFYHEVKILSEADETKKNSYLSLLKLTKEVLEQCIYLLGFSAPDRM